MRPATSKRVQKYYAFCSFWVQALKFVSSEPAVQVEVKQALGHPIGQLLSSQGLAFSVAATAAKHPSGCFQRQFESERDPTCKPVAYLGAWCHAGAAEPVAWQPQAVKQQGGCT